jgi:hypothetical protein
MGPSSPHVGILANSPCPPVKAPPCAQALGVPVGREERVVAFGEGFPDPEPERVRALPVGVRPRPLHPRPVRETGSSIWARGAALCSSRCRRCTRPSVPGSASKRDPVACDQARRNAVLSNHGFAVARGRRPGPALRPRGPSISSSPTRPSTRRVGAGRAWTDASTRRRTRSTARSRPSLPRPHTRSRRTGGASSFSMPGSSPRSCSVCPQPASRPAPPASWSTTTAARLHASSSWPGRDGGGLVVDQR